MKTFEKGFLVLSITLAMTACRSAGTTGGISSEEIGETAVLLAGTKIAQTQTAVPTATMTAPPQPTYSPVPGENVLIIYTPQPDQQVYYDPAGWFSVNFPGRMEPDKNKPGVFGRFGGRIEIGYLSDLGTMSNINNVCAWIANVVEKGAENLTVYGVGIYNKDRCVVKSKPDSSFFIRYEVFENPGVGPEGRFAYVKTNNAYISYGFSWLKNTAETEFIPRLLPITEEELVEWETIAPFLSDVSIKEYELLPGTSPYDQVIWLRDIPGYVPEPQPATSRSKPEDELTLEEQLESLGYQLTAGEVGGTKNLYRDGRLLFENFHKIFGVYEFSTSSGPITAFIIVPNLGRSDAFLILNDAVYPWKYSHQEPQYTPSPVLYQDELLWLKVSADWDQVQVWTSDQRVVYSFTIYTEPIYSTRVFTSWNDHWVWEARDFLIQDGEILNEKFGFQEIFAWRLVDGYPAYLFRKDGRVGFSYAGKILPLEYQNVAHYLCCGYASSNPRFDENSVRFFAEREGVWYYVVVDFR